MSKPSRSAGCKWGMYEFLIGLLAICGIVALAWVGHTVMRQYMYTKDFHEASCTIANISNIGNAECQSCAVETERTKDGKRRKKERETECEDYTYPCYVILVNLTAADGNESTVFYQPTAAHSLDTSDCSFYTCDGEAEENTEIVEEFIKEVQARGSKAFTCFHDVTGTMSAAIGWIKYTRSDVLLGMTIPGVLTLLFLCILIFRCWVLNRKKY